jgi:hypothetical protein
MKSLIRFNNGMMQMPIHWQIGLLPLVMVNLILPLLSVGTSSEGNAIIRNLLTYEGESQ